ncbi:MAG TPA: DJ-1/PfpI family protein [Anaerolineales bacterium]
MQIVYLYVFETLSDWEPAYAIAGINNPAFQKEPGRFCVKTVGVTADPVTTIGGLTILPGITLDQVDPAHSAMLILPGGEGYDGGGHREALQKAKEFLARDVPVAAICGATAGMARAGMLDAVRHTSNAAVYLQMTGYHGAALYQNEPAVTDGNVITAGATAPIAFAREIFKKLGLYSDDVLAAWFGLYTTGNPEYFFRLQELTAPPSE